MSTEEKRSQSAGHGHEHDEPLAEGAEKTPRGARVMGIVRWVFLGIAIAAAAWTWISFAKVLRGDRSAFAQTEPKYQCPMHPQIVSSEPGECPICFMALEPIAKKPPPPASDGGPPGTATVELAVDRVQSFGVRTALVGEGDGSRGLRVTAYVAPPEQAVAEVHVRAAGFVERVLVGQTGVTVRAGQPLVLVYSPEVYQAQAELLAAEKWALPSLDGGVSTSAAANAARSKLMLLGMSKPEIDRVVEKKEPVRTISIGAPQKGFVTKKNVALGSYVTPETALFEIVDLSKVYVIADVFQRDLAQVKVGMTGRFTSTRSPGAPVTATVDLVYPQLDVLARTTRVRMVIENAKLDAGTMAFLPGEYGTVELDGAKTQALLVPRDAVVDTGKHTYVFVEIAPGTYAPRTVRLGGEDGERVVVLEGVKAGEKVVSGATFLVDSESRLRASLGEVQKP